MAEHLEGQGEYSGELHIAASADVVFAFVADVRNLPRYFAPITRAEASEDGQVTLQGEAEGHSFSGQGVIHANPAQHQLEWEAAQKYYSGRLSVTEVSHGKSNLSVQLSFHNHPESHREYRPDPNEVQQLLHQALQAIAEHVTKAAAKT